MNRIDELATYTLAANWYGGSHRFVAADQINNKPNGCGCGRENKKISFCNMRRWGGGQKSVINDRSTPAWKERLKVVPSLRWLLIEIVRTGFGLRDRERQHALGLHRNDVVLVLKGPFHYEELLGSQQQPVFLKQVWSDDCIGHPGFVFQAEKDETLGGARTLAGDDASSNAQMLAMGNAAEFARSADSHRFHPRAVISHGMRPDGHASAAEVGHEALFIIHGPQWGFGVRLRQFIQQRARMADRALDLPEGVAAMKFPVSSFRFPVGPLGFEAGFTRN